VCTSGFVLWFIDGSSREVVGVINLNERSDVEVHLCNSTEQSGYDIFRHIPAAVGFDEVVFLLGDAQGDVTVSIHGLFLWVMYFES
jgi:hypothetical protein